MCPAFRCSSRPTLYNILTLSRITTCRLSAWVRMHVKDSCRIALGMHASPTQCTCSATSGLARISDTALELILAIKVS